MAVAVTVIVVVILVVVAAALALSALRLRSELERVEQEVRLAQWQLSRMTNAAMRELLDAARTDLDGRRL